MTSYSNEQKVSPEHAWWQMWHNTLLPWVDKYEDALANVQQQLGVVSVPRTRSQLVCSGESCEMKVEEIPVGFFVHPNSTNKLHCVFALASELGNEVFYALWATTVAIFLDPAVASVLLFAWSVGMYIGQFLKDSLKLPRPGLRKGSPVVRLETTYAAEYGFPSTHALGSFSLPLLTILLLNEYQVHSQGLYMLITAFCVFWTVVTPISRLYLGVHSFLDVLSGLLLGLFMTALSYLCMPLLYTLATPNGALAFTVLALQAAKIYPRSNTKWSNACGDTALILGTAAGSLCGLALVPVVPLYRIVALPVDTTSMINTLIRLIGTVVIVYAIRLSLRPTVYKIVRRMMHKPSTPPPGTGGDKHHNIGSIKKWVTDLTIQEIYVLECTEKFLGFFFMGFLASYILPPMWENLLGLTIHMPLQ